MNNIGGIATCAEFLVAKINKVPASINKICGGRRRTKECNNARYPDGSGIME